MPDDKNRKATWNTDGMIWHAKALQRVAKELNSDGSKSPKSDLLLFSGKLVAGPILLSLAIEIALKAWQCQERQGAPDPTHDLVKLFEGLEPATQKQLQEKMPAVPDPWLGPAFMVYEGLYELLRSHRNEHTHWRYLYEDPFGKFETSELDRALTVIIGTYDKRWRSSPWAQDR